MVLKTTQNVQQLGHCFHTPVCIKLLLTFTCSVDNYVFRLEILTIFLNAV